MFGTPAAAAVPTEPATSSTGSVRSGGGAGSDALHAANFDAVADVTDALTAPETEGGAQPLSSRSNSNSPATEKRKRKQRKGKDPEVVEGDDLANTPKMIALVWSSLALNLAYLLQVNTHDPCAAAPLCASVSGRLFSRCDVENNPYL